MRKLLLEAGEGAATLCNSSTITLNIVNLKIENITNGLWIWQKGSIDRMLNIQGYYS